MHLPLLPITDFLLYVAGDTRIKFKYALQKSFRSVRQLPDIIHHSLTGHTWGIHAPGYVDRVVLACLGIVDRRFVPTICTGRMFTQKKQFEFFFDRWYVKGNPRVNVSKTLKLIFEFHDLRNKVVRWAGNGVYSRRAKPALHRRE